MDIDTFELEDALHDARMVYDLTTIGNGLFCGVYELRMDADLTTVRKLIDGGVGHHWMFDSVHYKESNMWGERFFSCRDSYSPSSWDVFNRFEGAIYEIPEQCTSRASQRAQEASKWLPSYGCAPRRCVRRGSGGCLIRGWQGRGVLGTTPGAEVADLDLAERTRRTQ